MLPSELSLMHNNPDLEIIVVSDDILWHWNS